MEAGGFERRKFPRAEIPCRIVVDSTTKLFATNTVNISEGGIRVILKARLDTLVDIDLELMLEEERIIRCKGKVAWVLEIPDPEQPEKTSYNTGIEFQELSIQDKDEIRDLIHKIILEEKERDGAG